jgi:leucyl-tRNA synthetase
MGPPTDDAAWNENGVDGARRFLDRVWKIATTDHAFIDRSPDERDRDLIGLTHRTIRKVTEDIERFHFNTAVPALMVLSNELNTYVDDDPIRSTFEEVLRSLLLMLSPLTPHISHELWEMMGYGEMLATESWPAWDDELAREETVTLVVQVNGRVRDRFDVSADITAEQAEQVALASKKIQEWIDGKEVSRVISRPPNLVNVVVG